MARFYVFHFFVWSLAVIFSHNSLKKSYGRQHHHVTILENFSKMAPYIKIYPSEHWIQPPHFFRLEAPDFTLYVLKMCFTISRKLRCLLRLLSLAMPVQASFKKLQKYYRMVGRKGLHRGDQGWRFWVGRVGPDPPGPTQRQKLRKNCKNWVWVGPTENK